MLQNIYLGQELHYKTFIHWLNIPKAQNIYLGQELRYKTFLL